MIPPDENAMQKEDEAVRKSNVIIIAILMVASIAFLWLWNYLGFHLIDMRDLVITILWWIITIGLCIAIHIAEKRRRERIRTIFISDGVLYNPEVGVVRLESNDPQAYVDGMREPVGQPQLRSQREPRCEPEAPAFQLHRALSQVLR